MPVVPQPQEHAYIASRLGPILERLRVDEALQAQFFAFSRERGAGQILMSKRLDRAFRSKDKGHLSTFFAIILADFEASMSRATARVQSARTAKK